MGLARVLVIWTVLSGGAGFLWSAMQQEPAAAISGSSGRTGSSRGAPALKPLAAKPTYCKPGLPGCIPEDIAHVFMLSLPESGEEAVMTWIDKAGGPGSMGMQLAGCNLAGAMADASYCLSMTGEHHTPQVKDSTCNSQRLALGLLHQQPLFERLGCNFAVGQYDMSVLYALPKEVLERTLVVLVVRDPVQQAAAVHRIFAQLDPGRMCPGVEFKQGDPIELARCTKLSDFIRRGFAGAHHANALVRRLAGDYCCYQSEAFAEEEARIQAALTNLQRIGVVIDAEDMMSGLQYLANVLGWSTGAETPSVQRLPTERVSPDEQEKAEGLLARDYALYDVLQQRVADQVAYVAAENAQQ
ncbi:hypothetical protein ABPG75_004704 [Micractinium tetrahymenae]